MNYHKTGVIDLESTGLIGKIEVPGKRANTTKKIQMPYETHFNKYPYIVSIAWKIDTNETKEYILNQEGRIIPQEVIDIHGITNEMCEKSDKTFADVLPEFIWDLDGCEIIVGHGIYFDTSIIKANVLRLVNAPDDPEKEMRFYSDTFEIITEILHKNKRIDTMRKTIKMMGKWATLSELHMKIFQRGFDAHHAKDDVEATKRCFDWLLRKGIVPTVEQMKEKIKEKEAIEGIAKALDNKKNL